MALQGSERFGVVIPGVVTDPDGRQVVVGVNGAGAGGSSSTATSAGSAASVGVASAQVIAANAARKGLAMVNTSPNMVSLGLGGAAVLASGITLMPNGGSWDGTISGALWTGSVAAIAGAAASNLAFVEVS